MDTTQDNFFYDQNLNLKLNLKAINVHFHEKSSRH